MQGRGPAEPVTGLAHAAGLGAASWPDSSPRAGTLDQADLRAARGRAGLAGAELTGGSSWTAHRGAQRGSWQTACRHLPLALTSDRGPPRHLHHEAVCKVLAFEYLVLSCPGRHNHHPHFWVKKLRLGGLTRPPRVGGARGRSEPDPWPNALPETPVSSWQPEQQGRSFGGPVGNGTLSWPTQALIDGAPAPGEWAGLGALHLHNS